MKKNILALILFLFPAGLLSQEHIYFPPLNSEEWETISPDEMNWNSDEIPALYDYLEEKNSKAFLLLKDGRIVLEKYFDSFTKDSLWYWASAGKTLTATLVGLAQEEGFLSISDKTSDYLGEGWTSLPPKKEDLITIRHQLTMTSGLDDRSGNADCTDAECLVYKSDAGTRWAYHNPPYTLLREVIENASEVNFNLFYRTRLRDRIGMNGAFFRNGYNNVCASSPRSMARFGTMIMAGGQWEGETIINDKEYLRDMINTSQDINLSYGYLWWLNGKESCMAPGSQIVFNQALMPNHAPSEMYSALGKNGQILNIVPSKGLTLVRMGDRPDDDDFISITFNDEIWQFVNRIIAPSTHINETEADFVIYPNPASETIFVTLPKFATSATEGSATEGLSPRLRAQTITICNSLGQAVYQQTINNLSIQIDISELPEGVYFVQYGDIFQKFMVMR